MLSNCDLKFVSSAYPRAGFRIPRTDKNSGKSLIKLENSSTANASVNQNTWSLKISVLSL